MKQRLGVALSVLFISSICFAMGMVGSWVDPIIARQDVTRVGSQGASRFAGTSAELAGGHTMSQVGAHDTSCAVDASSTENGLDPWLPIAVALSSGVIVVRISCLRHDASEGS